MIIGVGLPSKLDENIAETPFLHVVEQIADVFGWMRYHAPDNIPYETRAGRKRIQNIKRGWLDIVLAHPARGLLLFRELKTNTGKVTPDQQKWLDVLAARGLDVGVWRPRDLELIVATLGPG